MKAHDNSELAYVLKQNGEVKYKHNTRNTTNLSFLDVEHGKYELELNLPKGYSINDRTFEYNQALTKTKDVKIIVDVNSTGLYQNMSLYFTKRAETKVIFNFVDENGNKIEGLNPVVKNAPVTIKEGKTFITRLRASDLPEGYKFAKVNTYSVEAETIYGSTKEVDVPLKVKDTDVTVSFNVKDLKGSTKFLPQYTYTEVLTEDNKNFKDNGDGTYTYEMPSEKLPLGYKPRLENDGKVVVKKFGSERLLVELERSKGQVRISLQQTNASDKKPVPVLVSEDGIEYELTSNTVLGHGSGEIRRIWETEKTSVPSGKYKLVFRDIENGQNVEILNLYPNLSSKVQELPDKETRLSGKADEEFNLSFDFDQNQFPSLRYVYLGVDVTEEVKRYQIGLEVRGLDNKKISDVKVEVLDKEGNLVNGKFNDNLQYLTDDLDFGTYTVKLSELPENTKAVLNENTFNKAKETENTNEFTLEVSKENLITASSNRVWGAFKLVEDTVIVEYKVNSNAHEDVKLPEAQEVVKGTKIRLPELELPQGKVLLGYNVNGGRYSVTNQAGDEIEINKDTTIVAIITSENARAKFVFHEEEFSGKFSTKTLNTDVIRAFNVSVQDENKGEITSVLSGKELLVAMLSKGTHTFELETPGYEIVKIVDEKGNELIKNTLKYPVRANGDNLGSRTVFIQVKEIEPETPEEPVSVKLTFSPGEGVWADGSTDDRVIEANKGDVIEILEAPVRDGYKFLFWKGSEYQPGDKYTVEGEHAFVAQWEKEEETPEEPETPGEPETPEEPEIPEDPEKEVPLTPLEPAESVEETEKEITKETVEETEKSKKNPSTGDIGVMLSAITLAVSSGALLFTKRNKKEDN